MPTGSPFESDLRAVREDRGLSLDEIQQETRIPVDVLRRFEEGDLVGDPSYNEVYLKAFLKSYAKAVGLPVGRVLTAYDAHRSGSYAGDLATGSASASGPDAPPAKAPDAPAAPTVPAEPEPVRDEAPQVATSDPDPPSAPPAPRPASGVPPAVQALASTPSPAERPAPVRTTTSTRVSRPAVPTARRSFDKNWGTILGLFGVLVVGLAVALWFLVFDGGDDPIEIETPDAVAVGSEGSDADDEAEAGGGPPLEIPIRLVVNAQGDGLQWFRVTEDSDDRTPYWIDMGSSRTFEADSAIVVWGEGNEAGPALAFEEASFELQGIPFSYPSGKTLRITRSTGQRLLDSLAAVGP